MYHNDSVELTIYWWANTYFLPLELRKSIHSWFKNSLWPSLHSINSYL